MRLRIQLRFKFNNSITIRRFTNETPKNESMRKADGVGVLTKFHFLGFFGTLISGHFESPEKFTYDCYDLFQEW